MYRHIFQSLPPQCSTPKGLSALTSIDRRIVVDISSQVFRDLEYYVSLFYLEGVGKHHIILIPIFFGAQAWGSTLSTVVTTSRQGARKSSRAMPCRWHSFEVEHRPDLPSRLSSLYSFEKECSFRLSSLMETGRSLDLFALRD